MSSSPGSRSAWISSTPSASCFALGPFGIFDLSVYGLRTTPIGCSVTSVMTPG